MTDNIKPKHYRKGEIDLYEAFSQIFPHNEYRAGMQMIAMRYMFRDKIDRVEDLKKAIYSLERLKEKEIEYKEAQEKEKALENELANLGEALRGLTTSENIHKLNNQDYASVLMSLLSRGFEYVARDSDGELAVYDVKPVKFNTRWSDDLGDWIEPLNNDYFPEVKWSDKEPTKVADLWEIYSKVDGSTNLEIKAAGEYSNWTYLDHTDLLKELLNDDHLYLTRDRDGVLYASDGEPYKVKDLGFWDVHIIFDREPIQNDNFPEVKWSDDEPTKIADLLDIYGNGGENGDLED